MKKVSLETAWGWVDVAFTEKGVYSSSLPSPTFSSFGSLLLPLEKPPSLEIGEDALVLKLIRLYFQGEAVNFNSLRLDFSGYSDFSQAVFSQLRRVPLGETISYQELARLVGEERSFRAVGKALGSNRLLVIVPCHRVVRSNGSLGGFKAGLEWKRRLLFWERLIRGAQNAY